MARVVALNSFPIKGCAPVSLSDARLTPAGLAHDRSFMVIDEHGLFRSQRREPRLALIEPEVSADGAQLTLRAAGLRELVVDVDLTGGRRPVRMFGRPYRGIDQGEVVAGWLSEFLGVPSRLVRVPPEHDRVTSGEVPGTAAYADGGALLLVSAASLLTLNERIAGRGAQPVPMSRFRPNIVIDGWDVPHVEDEARRITVGDCELAYTKLAVRCSVTLVDQAAAVKAGPEPIRTLADYRRSPAGGVAFGSKFAVLRTGAMSVGDAVLVTSWRGSAM